MASTVTARVVSTSPCCALISGAVTCRPLMTPISRATPRTLKQSPRFGVIEMSNTLLSRPR